MFLNFIINEKYWTGAFDGLAEGTTNFVGSGLPFPAALTIEGKSCMFVILSDVWIYN